MNRSWSPRALLVGLGLFAALGATSCGHCPEHQQVKGGGVLEKPLSPEADRKLFVGRVESSGPLAADLKPIVQATADTLFDKTFGKATPGVQRAASTCFQGGCVYEVVYRDRCALAAFSQQFYGPAGGPLRRWPGAIYRSPPLAGKDSSIQVTWALLIDDPASKRDQLLAAAKAVDSQPIAIIPDRCAAGDATPAPPTQSSAPPEVK